MNNIFRFLIGLAVFFMVLLLIGLGLIIISPLIIAGIIIYLLIAGIILIVYITGVFIAFIWHISQNQPELGKNKTYSIKQGKEV